MTGTHQGGSRDSPTVNDHEVRSLAGKVRAVFLRLEQLDQPALATQAKMLYHQILEKRQKNEQQDKEMQSLQEGEAQRKLRSK